MGFKLYVIQMAKLLSAKDRKRGSTLFLRCVAKTSTALVLLRFAATMFTMNAAVKPQEFEITT